MTLNWAGLFNLQGSHSQITVIIQGFTDQPANTGIDKKVSPARILIAVYRWRQTVLDNENCWEPVLADADIQVPEKHNLPG